MVETLRGLQSGTVHPQPQDHAKATLAPILKKEDGKIDFHSTAQEILNRLRGFQPWPGAYTSFRGKNLHIWAAQPIERAVASAELLVESGSLIAGCGDGKRAAIARSATRRQEAHARSRLRPRLSTPQRRDARKLRTGNSSLITGLLETPCPLLRLAPRLSTSCFALSSRTPTHPNYCTRANTPSCHQRTTAWPPNWSWECCGGGRCWMHEIGRFSDKRVEKLDIEVLTALRLAAYQLLFLDRIPGRAAVHESVELVKRARKGSAAPFANAVLRKLAGSSASAEKRWKRQSQEVRQSSRNNWRIRCGWWSAGCGSSVWPGRSRSAAYDQHAPAAAVRLAGAGTEDRAEG